MPVICPKTKRDGHQSSALSAVWGLVTRIKIRSFEGKLVSRLTEPDGAVLRGRAENAAKLESRLEFVQQTFRRIGRLRAVGQRSLNETRIEANLLAPPAPSAAGGIRGPDSEVLPTVFHQWGESDGACVCVDESK